MWSESLPNPLPLLSFNRCQAPIMVWKFSFPHLLPPIRSFTFITSSESLAHFILPCSLPLIGRKLIRASFHQMWFFFLSSSQANLTYFSYKMLFCVHTNIDLVHVIIALILSSSYYRIMPPTSWYRASFAFEVFFVCLFLFFFILNSLTFDTMLNFPFQTN